MDEIKLNRLKGYYKDGTPTEKDVNAYWQELSPRLQNRQYHRHHYTFRYATFVMVMAFFFAGVMIVGVNASGPTSPFYPVKEFSLTATAKLSGKYEALIEHRTDAIINAAQRKSDSEIKKAAADYEKVIQEATARQQHDQNKDTALKETLKKSEAKLKAISPASENAKNIIHQSIHATEKTQQEVKGAQTAVTPAPKSEENPSAEHKSETPGNSESHTNQGSENSGRQNADHGNNKP